MYYKDLTSYEYHESGIGKNIVNIGWLNKDNNYIKSSKPNVEVAKILITLWDDRTLRTRGFHICNLCENESAPTYFDDINGKSYLLGSAEFRIHSTRSNLIFAVPDMIIHYLLDHNYQPPSEFVDAVLELKNS